MKTKTLLYLLIILQSHTIFSQRLVTEVRDWKPADTSSYCGTYTYMPEDLFNQAVDQIKFNYDNGAFGVTYINNDLEKEIPARNLSVKGNQFSFEIIIDNKPVSYQGKFIIYNEKVTWDVGDNKPSVNNYHNQKGVSIEGGGYYLKQRTMTVTGSSVLIEKNKDANYFQASNVLDCNYSTAWVEGVAGAGIGQNLQFTFENAWMPKEISIVNGFAISNSLYLKNARPKELKLTFSDGTVQIITLKDIMTLQTFTLNTQQKISGLKIEIVSVYKGTLYEDTCISEIDFN